MKHLNIGDSEFLDALCGGSGRVQESFEDLLSRLEDDLENGELTIDEVIYILENT